MTYGHSKNLNHYSFLKKVNIAQEEKENTELIWKKCKNLLENKCDD